MKRVDTQTILSGLKDFQRASVDYVFRRMYEADPPARRFLLADEVGLGKTLVAKGVIARAIDHLQDNVDRIDVLYICSNLDIARQNINRLNVTGERDAVFPSRITLLPQTIRDLQHRGLNFITFTPGTSFDLKSRMGRAEERVLLYWMLRESWAFRGSAPKNVLQGNSKREPFRHRLASFDENQIDRDLLEAFRKALEKRIESDRADGKADMSSRFEELCERFGRSRQSQPKEDKRDRAVLIGELRELLAASCLQALEPDLVILDEFQRFKHLLEPGDDDNTLARNLFDYPEARILLLSATPYKMYTIADEIEGEHHYDDFLRTMRFLEHDQARTDEFERMLKDYRREIVTRGREDSSKLRSLKQEIQERLRLVMIRTERLSVTPDRSGMLEQAGCCGVALEAGDLEAYLGMARIGRVLEHSEPIEYWKSCPYALSFMDEYKLKHDFMQAGQDAGLRRALGQVLRDVPAVLLNGTSVDDYGAVGAVNPRMRSLVAQMIESGGWQLLWMPPSLPYYQPGGPFARAEANKLTKRLVFSSWKMVPKAIACLASYEAERRMICLSPGAQAYSAEARKKRRPLLRFALSQKRLTGMPVLGLIYPSFALAGLCDPLAFAARWTRDPLAAEEESAGGEAPAPKSGMASPGQAELLRWAEDRIHAALRELPQSLASAAKTGQADEAWYWAAPILLDLALDRARTREWLLQQGLARTWSNREEGSAWSDLAPMDVGSDDDKGEDENDSQDDIEEDDDDDDDEELDEEWDDDDEQDDDDDEDGDASEGVGSRWSDHVERARQLLKGAGDLGPQPKDLVPVLARMAVAGFGVTALRALGRSEADASSLRSPELRDRAGAVAWGFLQLFNLPESISLVRHLYPTESEDAYWSAALRYCLDGGLQSVLDEYVHVLSDTLGLRQKPWSEAVGTVAEEVLGGLGLRTTRLGVDVLRPSASRKRLPVDKMFMRARFAARFGQEESEDGGAANRTEQVRTAFNSPFWPHVLATTSVGQEGLDFHLYCHAVVHWNLPANPVDLEQREGRVHRYKGHAIRKNLARQYGVLPDVLNGGPFAGDPWQTLFDRAIADREAGSSDIVPFWVYAPKGGARIERHVPLLPLSAEEERLIALRRSLAVYRMVFGQARQDELLEYLTRTLGPEEVERVARELVFDLGPEAK